MLKKTSKNPSVPVDKENQKNAYYRDHKCIYCGQTPQGDEEYSTIRSGWCCEKCYDMYRTELIIDKKPVWPKRHRTDED